MNIQISNNYPPPISMDDFLTKLKSWFFITYLDTKNKDISNSKDIQRLIKMIVKGGHSYLQIHHIFFECDIPIFMCHNKILSGLIIEKGNIDINNISFEDNSKLNSVELIALSNIFKKIKTCLKELNIQDNEKIKYFLPESTLLKVTMMISFLDIFHIAAISKNSSNSKFNEFGILLFKKAHETYPEIFNNYNMSVYLASKERDCD